MPLLTFGRREWLRLAVAVAVGLAVGLAASWYIYDSLLTWVPPAMTAVWTAAEVQRVRRARRAKDDSP